MEQEEKKQFDVDREITLHIPSPAGRKTITVRYPTDDEWKARMRDQQTIQRSFSKGESETEVLNGEAVDAKLLAKIRTDEGGSEVDEYEASAVISNLARAKDVEIERGGNGFRVSFTAFGGARVSHLLRMPSLKQIG
ncbi:MAG: hypothetical protein M1541_00680, partial [Acidobacteria bacterium]|nr:hypothetical protein [Acidobacteriota bacterium]